MDFELIVITEDDFNFLLVVENYHVQKPSTKYDPSEDESFDCDVYFIPSALAANTSFNVAETKLLQELPELMSGEIVDYFSDAITAEAYRIGQSLLEEQANQRYIDSAAH